MVEGQTHTIIKQAWFGITVVVISLCLWFVSPASAKGDLILVIRPEGKAFMDATKGLKEGLGDDFNIHELVLASGISDRKVYERMSSTYPRLVVLMDNKAIRLYKKYQSTTALDTINITPSISLMAVLVEDAIKGIKNGVGISYEIPLVTSASALRSAINQPIKNIGIVHRPFMNTFIESNREFCKEEKIKITSITIEDRDDYKFAIKKNLKKILKEKQTDALWIPNDNVLLQPEIIRDVWMPFVRRFKKPVIVGIEILAHPKLNFGTIAVLPDHSSLGAQMAEMVFDVKENGWKFSVSKTDPPISVIKIINSVQAKKQFKSTDNQFENFDKILK